MTCTAIEDNFEHFLNERKGKADCHVPLSELVSLEHDSPIRL